VSPFRPWRVLTWKHWAWATATPVFLAIYMPLQVFDTNWYWAPWSMLFNAPLFMFYSYDILLAIAVVESSVPRDARPPIWRYVVALLAATTIFVAALGAFPEVVRNAPRQVIAGQTTLPKATGSPEERAKARRINTPIGFTVPIAFGWVAAFIYVRLRNAQRAARALAGAELERSEAQRNLLAAQLVAAHAQVDPAFVLQKLEELERTYEDDSVRADVLLDEFIVFLRDAIPRLRAEERAQAT